MLNSFRPGYHSPVIFGVIFTPLFVYGLSQFFEFQPIYSTIFMLSAWALGLFYLWNDRKIQVFQHTNLQLIGLHLIRDNFAWVQEKFSEDELHALLQKYLSNDAWRNQALLLFRESSWRCVVDPHSKPVLYRWELKLKMPSSWAYEKEQLAFAAMIFGCIPQQQDFTARWVDGYVLIRGGIFSSEQVPVRIDQVTESLAFWKIFQLHLNTMLDTFSGYSHPVFVHGMVVELFMEYPCAFLLKDGSHLRIDEISVNDHISYKATVTSADEKHSNTQSYNAIEDLWWVWRHAIEKSIELPEMVAKKAARAVYLKQLFMQLIQKHFQ